MRTDKITVTFLITENISVFFSVFFKVGYLFAYKFKACKNFAQFAAVIFGNFFAKFGIKIAYTKLGIIFALVFVGIPFVVRSVQPVLEKLDGSYEEAMEILGATPFQAFRKAVFPEIWPALAGGFTMAFDREVPLLPVFVCLGEYGSVVFIAGNKPFDTEIAPLLIMSKLQEFDYAAATSIALLMLVTAFVILMINSVIQYKAAKKVK